MNTEFDNANVSTTMADRSNMSTPIGARHPASAATPLASAANTASPPTNPFINRRAPIREPALTDPYITPHPHRTGLLTQAHNAPVLKGTEGFA